jgi:RNA polymerase sigma-70 factor (ECF subfamily)
VIERTTTALLSDLRDPGNQEAWSAFDARCRPILIALGRRLGLAPEDAADAAQETLLRFVREYRAGKYARERGGLRAWLLGIARRCIADAGRARRPARGESALENLPDEAEVTRLWDEGYRQWLLERAMERLRASPRLEARTLRAFEMIALERRSPADAADSTGLSLNDVYLAKHRCLKRLRALVARLDGDYAIPGEEP